MSVAQNNIMSAHGGATALNGESLGKCFLFISVLFLLFIPNVSKKYYHNTLSYQLSAQHKVGLVSVACENVVSYHGGATSINR